LGIGDWGLANPQSPIPNPHRTKFENNLTFLGFIIFKNKLKKDSKDVITTLKECNSKLILATGDNPFTSISVARECEMMDFHKKVFMIDLEKDMLDNFREKIKITPLVIQRRLNGSKLSLKEDIRSSSSRSTLTRQTGRNVDSNHIEADGETRKRQNSKRRKTSNTVDVQNLTSIQQVSQPIKINQQYSTISDRQSMICSERQLLPVKLNKYENKNSTADSLENFQNSFRKLLSSDSYICISGKAFEYVIQNCRKIKNEENPNNINLASPLFNECSSVKNSIPPSEILKLIEKKGKIFYRMSPNHKVELVRLFRQEKNNVVSMVGDGANDCGALMCSDVGISITSKDGKFFLGAHFWSSEESISCVVRILKVGRACFENSVIILKFKILYAVIQVTTTMIVYLFDRDYSNSQWLFIDFFVVLATCILATKTGTGYHLNNTVKIFSVFDRVFISSVIGQIIIQVSMQIVVYFVFKNFRFSMMNTPPYAFDGVREFY
jgi:cation-transporting P-type ATPase 13A2